MMFRQTHLTFSGEQGSRVISSLFEVLDEFLLGILGREGEFGSCGEMWGIYDDLANVIDDFSFRLESEGFFVLDLSIFSIFLRMEKFGFDVCADFHRSSSLFFVG